jgi:predicted permease
VNRFRLLVARLSALLRVGQLDREMDEEIDAHLDEATDEYIERGLPPGAARLEALRHFGGVARSRELHREARTFVWLDQLRQDLRYAARMLGRAPGFAVVAVVSLGLGIGANTAIFSLVNAAMLRRLPVAHPGGLVQITRLLDHRPGVVSFPLFEYFRDNLTTISGTFAQQAATQAILIDGEQEIVSTDYVSGDYYAVLGLQPAAGRLLQATDDTAASASSAAVMSDRYWTRRFGRAPSAIGRTFSIGDRVFTIVGVTPPEYLSATVGHAPDLSLPLMTKVATGPQYRSAEFNWLNMLARLRPGATLDQANAEVDALFRSFAQTEGAQLPEQEREAMLRQRAVALAAPGGFNPFRESIGRPLLLLMGIVGLILLLACVNLSGLLVARTAARQREIAVRLALGVSRGRLVRQFLTESLLLAGLGGALGFLFAQWLGATLLALFVNGRDLVLSVAPDGRVLWFTAATSALTCLVAGLMPALQAGRVNANPIIRDMAPRRRFLGELLVVAQLAISMMLVVGAFLFVATFLKLSTVDRGFQSEGLLVASLRGDRVLPPARATAARQDLLERLRALPDVQAASAGLILPIGGILIDRNVRVAGGVSEPTETERVGFNVVAPRYFATLGTPLLAGRDLTERDTAGALPVALVNRSFERRFFGDHSAIGHQVTSADVKYDIVGVVADAKYQSLRVDMTSTMYVSWLQLSPAQQLQRQDQPSTYNYVMRTTGDPLQLVPALDPVVHGVDPGLRIRTTVPYDTIIERSIATERIMAMLGGVFAILAVILAAFGVFGLLAFRVARRTNEIGVRMALGAGRWRVMHLVMRDLLVIAIAGIGLGIAGAVTVTRLAATLLYGVTPGDPPVFATAAAVLTTAAIAAAWLPALRASRVDPLAALRHE